MTDDILVLRPDGSDRDIERTAIINGGPAILVDLLGVRAWSIGDPEVSKKLMSDSRISKSPRNWPLYPSSVVGKWPLMAWLVVKNLATTDGADHRRLRDLVAPALGPQRIAALIPRIEGHAATLLDALAVVSSTQSTVDLAERYTSALAALVIGDLLGLPDQLRVPFQRVATSTFDTTLEVEQQSATMHEFFSLIQDLIETKRAEPGDDLTSLLVASHDKADRDLTERELTGLLANLITPSHVLPVSLMGNAIVALLSNPEQLSHIRAGHATWNDVVEESLRLEGPIKRAPMRYALEDIQIANGLTIRRGDAILIPYSVTGRHPKQHGDTADQFDVTRPDKEHLAFGHGPHYCLGAALARAQAATALPALFDRFPNMRLAASVATLQYQPSALVNGYASIPVHLSTNAVDPGGNNPNGISDRRDC